MSNMMRLDKFLSEASPWSRKEVRGLVKRGQITVNGIAAAQPDMKVDENTAQICVCGELIRYRKFIYLMLNKPAGYLSATEDDHDPVVTDLLPEELKHFAPFPVGRLDKDTTGLLLLTNDGHFDHELMSPKKNLYKRYEATLDAPACPEDAEKFQSGMTFKDFTAKPARLEIDPENPNHIFVEIAEGKFHQVKRMCEQVGKNVLSLKRIAIGNLKLDDSLPIGSIRELNTDEMKSLGF